MGKSIQLKIKEVKRYFKADFKVHIDKEENCADHCTTHSLSDPKTEHYKGTCNHNHNIVCERCESLEHVLQEIKYELELTEAKEQSRIRFEAVRIFNLCLESTFVAYYYTGRSKARDSE